MPENDLYEFALRCEFKGQPVINVFHAKMSEETDLTINTAEKAAAAYWNAMEAAVEALTTNDLEIFEMTGQRIAKAGQAYPSVRGPLFIHPINSTGDQAVEALPGFATHYIKFVALRDDDSTILGAKYIGAVPEPGQVDGLLTPAQLLLLEDVAEAIQLEFIDADLNSFTPVIFSLTEWKAAAVNPWYPYAAHTSSGRVSHIDRRKIGTARGGY